MPNIDWQRLLQAAQPLIVALANKGPKGAAFAQAYLQSMEHLRRNRLQEQQFGMQQQRLSQQDAYQQAQLENIRADNARQNESLDLQRKRDALNRLTTFREAAGDQATAVAATAQEPLAAQNQLATDLFQQTQEFDVPARAARGFLPDMTAAVSRGASSDAAKVLGTLTAKAKEHGETITDQKVSILWDGLSPRLKKALVAGGHPSGQPVKPSQFEAFGGVGAVVPQTGAPYQPTARGGSGSIENQIASALEQGDTGAVDRLTKAATLASGARRDPDGPAPQYQWARDPVTGDVRLMTTDEIRRGGGQQPPTADMRNKTEGRRLVASSIMAIEALSKKVITKIGPAQRAEAIKRGAEAVFGHDPEYRTYQDARMALAGNLAVGQQGSRPSDADIRAIWLPLVPDMFKDTTESAAMKWDLIRTMSNTPPSERVSTGPAANPFRPQ